LNLSQVATAAVVSAVVLLGSACSTAAIVPPTTAQDDAAAAERASASREPAHASPAELAIVTTAAFNAPAVTPAPTVPLASTSLAADETQVARYTTVSTAPGEADANPLAVIAKVHFPREVVSTVGDAVRYLLIRTGFRLLPQDRMHPTVADVFALPLPDNPRVLGPYRVEALLGVLMGKPYMLRVDPALRTISYDTTPTAAATPSAATDTAPSKPSSLVGALPPHPGSVDPAAANRSATTSGAI
jgi:type IV pili sensor histidine kinase/response regulator